MFPLKSYGELCILLVLNIGILRKGFRKFFLCNFAKFDKSGIIYFDNGDLEFQLGQGMKIKSVFSFLFCVLFISSISYAGTSYSGGSGEWNDPYLISTSDDWVELTDTSDDWSSHFIMTADIDLGGVSNLVPIGNSDHRFTGVFNGSGYSVSNASFSMELENYVSLFGIINTPAVIKNFGVENVNILGQSRVGGLVGYSNHGDIINCYSSGSVQGESATGGLVGFLNHGKTLNCYSLCSVIGDEEIGGLVGCSHFADIINAYSAGSLTGYAVVGGIIGHNDTSVVKDCFWDVELSGVLVGIGDSSSDGVKGLSTAGMQDVNNFINAGWDFVSDFNGEEDVWIMDGYPVFSWRVKYSGGSGSEADPYKIVTIIDWLELTDTPNDWASCFVLMCDIDFDGVENLKPVAMDVMSDDDYTFNGTVFSGKFDGQGYVISNAVIDMPDSSYVGLFGILGQNAEIRNLGLENINVFGGSFYIGALAGYTLDYSKIERCYSTGRVVGMVEGTRTFPGSMNVGGLVGSNDSYIVHCYSSCSVIGSGTVGGFVGWGSGDINDCYATGLVQGEGFVGGFVGISSSCIKNCYSTGSVSGFAYIGGFVGEGSSDESLNCFWDVDASLQITSPGGLGLSTVEMQTVSTYINAGWDFSVSDGDSADWQMTDGYYPKLAWQNMKYSSGSGIEEDPYEITTAADWVELTKSHRDWSKCFILTRDIDLGYVVGLVPVGTPDIPFTGVFDGSSHVISNVIIDLPIRSSVGLFGCLGMGGEVTGLGVVDVEISAYDSVGGLAGNVYGSSVRDCYVTGSVRGSDRVGGLLGRSDECSVIYCYSMGLVSGDFRVGGLLGDNDFSNVANCYSTSSVDGYWQVGGFVGSANSLFRNCYASGKVNAIDSSAGGFAGFIVHSDITNCYSIGSVTANDSFGGFVGSSIECTIESCFWDIESSMLSDGLGSFVYAGSNDVTGLTTEEMQDLNTFTDAGWDFIISDGDNAEWFMPLNSYPKLRPLSGRGILSDPYLIKDFSDFNLFANLAYADAYWASGVYIRLDCDIDLDPGLEGRKVYNGAVIAPNVDGFRDFIGVPFMGVFDGNGHVISNMTINPFGRGGLCSGLFGKVDGVDSAVKNLGLENLNIAEGYGTRLVGGLIGSLCEGTISNCYTTGSVIGYSSVGGLVGVHIEANIIGCYSTCSVESRGNSSEMIGGLIGFNMDGTVSNCYATGSVTGGDGSHCIGGLCGGDYYYQGNGEGVIANCYCTGSVIGGESSFNVGGFIGRGSGSIVSSYSSGFVDGSNYVGGFIGYGSEIVVNDCFWNVDLSGMTIGVGFSSLDGVRGLSTAEMQDVNNFVDAGWDFAGDDNGEEDFWVMDGYPTFPWAMVVDLKDFSMLANYWQVSDCVDGEPCRGADWNGDGNVDLYDLIILSENWLEKEMDVVIDD